MNYLTAIVNALSYHLRSNWYILLIGIVLAVGINVYLDPAKLRGFLNRRAGLSIPGAVAFGALTPLCACGTMAVLVSMFATVMPWGAVMAFLVASPLASPSDYMFQTAFLGSRFAVTMLISAVAMGLLGGLTAHVLEKKTDFFKGQFRLAKAEEASCENSHQLPAASRQPEGAVVCCVPAGNSAQHTEPHISSTSADCCSPALLAENKTQVTDDKRQTPAMSCCEQISQQEQSHQQPATSRQPMGNVGCCGPAGNSAQHTPPDISSNSADCCILTAQGTELSLQPIDASHQPTSNVGCCGTEDQPASLSSKLKLKELGQAFWDLGVKRILLYFVLFISIGTVVEMLIPSAWIYSAFGGGKAHSIPLSATIGLPLYVSSSSALPILSSLINAGAGEGAILAFLIAGSGTSLPVILGMSTFLKPKSISLYAFFVFGGSICAGYLYELILALFV